MGDAYPELRAAQARVTEVLQQEEERFFETIENGMEILEGGARRRGTQADSTANGVQAARHLRLPARPDGRRLPRARRHRRRSRLRRRAGRSSASRRRAAGKFKMAQGLEYSGATTTFHGYEHLVVETRKVVALYVDGSPVGLGDGRRRGRRRARPHAVLRRDRRPGGRHRRAAQRAASRLLVEDTLKIQADVFGHHGRVVRGHAQGGRRRRRPKSTPSAAPAPCATTAPRT